MLVGAPPAVENLSLSAPPMNNSSVSERLFEDGSAVVHGNQCSEQRESFMAGWLLVALLVTAFFHCILLW